MAKLSSDGKSVTVEKGDTLWAIARDYGNGLSYNQLASINGIPNPNLIYIGQVIKLSGVASSTRANNTSVATISQFGPMSNSENTLFATWTWSRNYTDHYETEWYYDTGDSVWFVGNKSTTTDKQSTYSIPSNAKRVKFRVKPVSQTYKSNDKETSYWTAGWSTEKIHSTGYNGLKTPSTPSVNIDKYTLTAELDNLDVNAPSIQFQVYKNDSVLYNSGIANITSTNHASYSCSIEAGAEYKVRCRAYKNSSTYSDWSDFSNSGGTMPAASSGITTIRANSETSVYLEWGASDTAESYNIEYTTKKEYFDGSNETHTISNVEFTHYEITGLESGQEYFFRIRAVNSNGESSWTSEKSVVIGKKPAPPTTWSSSTTVMTGEQLTLCWVHNTEDGSSQTYAELELYIDGVKDTYTIKNSEEEDEKDKTSSYIIDTSSYIEGTTIQWRVRTAGITKVYGDWSTQRTVDVYAPPTLELRLTDVNGNDLTSLTEFPFYVYGLAGPKTQIPIGYHVAITANESYETVDRIGVTKTIRKNEKVYSKYFSTNESLLIEISANNIDLENNISYTVTCTVSMNSGLTAENSLDFTVSWSEMKHEPNAEISIDKDSIVAYIRPYCEDYKLVFYKVEYSGGVYTSTTEEVTIVEGVPLEVSGITRINTTSGRQVFTGTTDTGSNVYYCTVEEKVLVEDVTLSVYRRDFDGSFIELATGISNLKNTFITDPHPALDYARYRIVSTSKTTGAVGYYDISGYPVGEKSIVIQWDEVWMNFDVSNEDEMEQPPCAGSMLKLPYNIDTSDDYSPDVSLVNYAGRENPVSYYGTQHGHSSNWKTEIPSSDKKTLYALRRLAIWMGNVYVREPSGSGYWASITVSFSQTHCKTTIPVTLKVTRVEGGA